MGAWVADQYSGQLKVGQSTRFRLQALPYRKYGAKTGRVEWIAVDVESIDAPDLGRINAYKVRLSLDETSFRDGEEDSPIQLGMSAEVSAVTGSETVLSLLWRKFKGKFAPSRSTTRLTMAESARPCMHAAAQSTRGTCGSFPVRSNASDRRMSASASRRRSGSRLISAILSASRAAFAYFPSRTQRIARQW